MSNIEEKITFGIAEAQDGSKVLFLGITKTAWETMQNGMAKDIDLASVGLPIKIIVFGTDDHDGLMKVLTGEFHKQGIPVLDERRVDFSINDIRR